MQYVWLKTKFYVNSTVMVSGSVRIHSTVYLYTNNGLLGFFLSLSVSFFPLSFKMKDEDPKKTIFRDRNRNTR